MKEVAIEGEARVPEMFAVKGLKGAFENPGSKAQTVGRQQGGRLAQVQEQTLLEQRQVLANTQRERQESSLEPLDRMGETESVGVKLCLYIRLIHPPAHNIVGQQQSVKFLIDQQRS